LGRFFTREDIKRQGLLLEYIVWAANIIKQADTDPTINAFLLVSVWRGLVSIFKILHRTDLLCIFEKTYKILFIGQDDSVKKEEYTTSVHFKVKLAQRLG